MYLNSNIVKYKYTSNIFVETVMCYSKVWISIIWKIKVIQQGCINFING